MTNGVTNSAGGEQEAFTWKFLSHRRRVLARPRPRQGLVLQPSCRDDSGANICAFNHCVWGVPAPLPRSPHIPLFEAILDEVDQAIAALQNARRFLGELERDTARRARVAPRPYDHADARESTPSLRYAGVTVAEAAQILEMSEEHVRRLLRTGELEGVPYSGRVGWRLSRAYVESLAEERLRAREKQAEARRLASKVQPPKRKD